MNEPLPNPVVRRLKSLAQKLEPVLSLGKSGASDAFLKSLDEALEQHELVKIRFAAFKDERKTLAPQLAAKTKSHLVWVLGHIAVFYRQQPDEAKRRMAV